MYFYLLGLDPSRVGTPPDKKNVKSATSVRDLIHSAIERNLSQETGLERPPTSQERPSKYCTYCIRLCISFTRV